MPKPAFVGAMEYWSYTVEIGDIVITPRSLLVGACLMIALFLCVSWFRRFVEKRVFPRLGLTEGVSAAVAALIGYALLVVGVLVVLPVMAPGFNINTLVVVLGALSFGVGFGLRNVADNFFSGLILLIERPIKVTDRIEIAGVFGTVMEIRARSTTVRTNDNIDIIVPNSQFIANQVTNLSHHDKRVRFKIPVGVHYDSDVDSVQKALLEAAAGCDGVLENPAPAVRLIGFADSAVNFELRVWTDSLYHRPKLLFSNVNFRIWKKFKEYGIRIPYPQRDLHVKEMPAGGAAKSDDGTRGNPDRNTRPT